MYYEVDDIPVMVDVDPVTFEMFAVNDLGNPWSPLKAAAEGRLITKAEFNKLKAIRKVELGLN